MILLYPQIYYFREHNCTPHTSNSSHENTSYNLNGAQLSYLPNNYHPYKDIRLAENIMKDMLRTTGKCDLTIDEIIYHYYKNNGAQWRTWKLE